MTFSRPLPSALFLTLTAALVGTPAPARSLQIDAEGDPPVEATAPADAVVTAVRASGPVRIDGRLDDAAWQDAPLMSDFIQRAPWDGQPATERTEVRTLFDDEALLIGVWAYDSNVDGIVPGEAIRDYQVEDSDAVVIILDTYRDEQNGFVFGTTPAGIEYDGQVANEGQGGGFFLGGGLNSRQRQQAGAGGGFNKNWDGSWTVATTRDARGWYAEFRIPFNTLRYGSENSSWGFNVSRRIRRKNEESFWSPVPREFSLYRLNYAGELAGLELPFRRLGTVTPYVLGSTARDYQTEDEFDQSSEVGGEAKLQLTQGLTLDLTVNTDFAQVEVDDQQVNLTRFSLLFPEKRPFFLENAGFFTVGGGGADLFFSRNIGIAGGQQVPILGGGRISGKAAGLNVGLLHIVTDDLDGVTAGNAYSVARVARELPNRSRVGGIVVNRSGDLDGDHNRTFALDGQVGIGEAVTLSSFVGRTETPGLGLDDHIVDLNLGWSSRNWRGSAQARDVGEHFNPEVGFAPREGYRYYQLFNMYYIRPESGLREIRPHVSYFTYLARKEGVARDFQESARLHVDAHFEWPDGMVFSPAMNWVREGLVQPFAIRGTDVVVAPGTYEGWEAAWRFNTNSSADVSFDAGIDWGSFLSGDRRGGFTTVTFRHGSAFSTALRVEYNDVELAEGSFQTTLAGVNLGYFFTPRIYVQSLIQYSDQIDRWSANVRFGWLNTAGTGLFIVYNDVQGVDDLSGPLGRSFIVKFTRQFNVLGG